jgi:hypothetical protein
MTSKNLQPSTYNLQPMELLLIPRPGDRERLLNQIQTLTSNTLEELVDAYNKSCEIGITGNQSQGLRLLALHKVFLNKCGTSPISWTDNMVLSLGDPVEVMGGSWRVKMK